VEVRLRVDKGRILLIAPYNTALVGAVKSVSGYSWNSKGKLWTFPATPIAAMDIVTALKACGFKVLGSDDFKALYSQSKVYSRADNARGNDQLPKIPVTRFDAWNHQKQAFWFAYDLNACLLALGMGCGKTKVTVDLIQNRRHKLTLVVGPNKVIVNDVWGKEFQKHCVIPCIVKSLEASSVSGKVALARKTIEQARVRNLPCILAVNYESLWREPFGPSYDASGRLIAPGFAKSAGFDFLVCDESHRAKSPKGKSSVFLAELAKVIPHRLLLTGTPMPHSPLDIWAQYRILDPAIFGESYFRFRHRYANMGGYQSRQVVGYKNQDELNKKFYTVAIKIESDVLDLPPEQDMTLYCELSRDAQKVYDSLHKDFCAQVQGGTVTAKNALEKILRLQQLTGGYLPVDVEGDIQKKQIDTAKSDLLADTLEDLPINEPVVVFCRFTADIGQVKKVAESQGRRFAELTGKADNLKEWQAGKADILAVQIDAGGEGVDMTRSRYAFYYSIGYSLGKYLQSRARIHRPGQTKPTIFYHLIAKKTIDERIFSALSKKQDVIKAVLDEIQQERKS
jgi:SNF2 family DNA or RNA helicase